MGWFTRKGQRVHGEGGYAVALTAHGWTPEDTPPPIEGNAQPTGVELTVEHQTHADLSPDEQADVDAAIADEAP